MQLSKVGHMKIFPLLLLVVSSPVLAQGARITVGADMPSMPMAHNSKPVRK